MSKHPRKIMTKQQRRANALSGLRRPATRVTLPKGTKRRNIAKKKSKA